MAIDLMCPYCGRVIRANPYRGKANFRAHVEACPKGPDKPTPEPTPPTTGPPAPPTDAEVDARIERRLATLREDAERMREARERDPSARFTPPF